MTQRPQQLLLAVETVIADTSWTCKVSVVLLQLPALRLEVGNLRESVITESWQSFLLLVLSGSLGHRTGLPSFK